MKALSVKQPWASLITAGLKTLEIRSRKTNYRGELGISSSQRQDASWKAQPAWGGLNRATPFEWEAPNGQAVCVVNLTNCRPMTPEDEARAWVPYQEGLWAWELDNVRPLKPFPVKGQLSIWTYQGECKDCAYSFSRDDTRCNHWFCDGKEWYPSAELFVEQIARAIAGEGER